MAGGYDLARLPRVVRVLVVASSEVKARHYVHSSADLRGRAVRGQSLALHLLLGASLIPAQARFTNPGCLAHRQLHL